MHVDVELSMPSVAEESFELDLADATFHYITESKYPGKCTKTKKRAIRKKAAMLVVRDGVMFFKKKKKGRVSMQIRMMGDWVIFLFCMQVVELRYIQTREEQVKILRSCHMDPTSGHLGMKKTVSRISERFWWRGIVKDVKEMV